MITFSPMLGEHEWAWMKKRTHVIACEDSMGIVAYDEKDDIVACCVADSIAIGKCDVHLAIDNPMVLKYGFLAEVARWLFVENDYDRVFGAVPSNNARALQFNEHIGFRRVGIRVDGIALGIDMIDMRMDRKDCKWLQVLKEAA